MEHSKTPWRVDVNGSGDARVQCADGWFIGFQSGKIRRDGSLPDNFAFAVHAANCHDELVAALRDLVEQADSTPRTQTLDRAYAILEKAEK